MVAGGWDLDLGVAADRSWFVLTDSMVAVLPAHPRKFHPDDPPSAMSDSQTRPFDSRALSCYKRDMQTFVGLSMDGSQVVTVPSGC